MVSGCNVGYCICRQRRGPGVVCALEVLVGQGQGEHAARLGLVPENDRPWRCRCSRLDEAEEDDDDEE